MKQLVPAVAGRAATLFFLAFCGSAVLDAARLPFRYYQTADGLPQSQVLALHQDYRGELWMGTWSGAARYDGAEFRALGQSAGLPTYFVFDIVEDAEGSLWLAAGAGVARLAPHDRSRVEAAFDPVLPRASGSWVRDLHVDRRGVVWAVTRLDGAAYYDGAGFRPVASPALVDDVFCVFTDAPTGELLLGTADGVRVVSEDGVRPWKDLPGPWERPISMLYTAPDGTLLLANDVGLWRITGDVAHEVTAGGEPIKGVLAALVDRRDRLWLGTVDGPYRQGRGGMERLGPDQGWRAQGRVYALFEDREGNLWLGCDGGLARHPGEIFRIYQASDGLTNENVWALSLDTENRLWIGTSDGVFVFDDERMRPLAEPHPLAGKRVRTILDDGRGGMWFGTHSDGIFRRAAAGWTHYLPPDIPSARIYGACRSRDGDLWFSTRKGVARYRDGGFELWTEADGLPGAYSWVVKEDPEGRIVVATVGGMARLEGERFTVPPELAPLRGIPVRSFMYRRNGELWAGTDGKGLQALRDGTWSHFGAGDGPSDDFNWGVIEDTRGRVWAASNHGLDVFDGERWINFSIRDGLLQDELSLNAALAAPDGSVWFGFNSGGGLVRFSSDLPAAERTPPILHITSVKTPAREVEGELSRLRLPWNERDVSFSYIGISLRDEDSVLYRTMLEGYDEDFGPPQRRRQVRYTNLEPGSYRFLVLAVGADGVWASEPASVEIEILPPVWRTWWFTLLSTLALGLVVFGGVRLRVRGIEAEKRALEARVAERTRELEAEKRRAEEALAEVKTLSGLLPICSSCKRVRDDRGYWNQIEEYVRRHSHAEFSHGICPTCMERVYSRYFDDTPPPVTKVARKKS